MFTIERFFEGEWKEASAHTKESDRDVQWDRFISGGILASDLRKSAR